MAEAGGGAVPSASSMPAVSLTTSIGTTNAGENKYFLFNGGNYPEWKFQTLVYVMKILMVAESDINMIDIINGTSEPPTVGPKVAEYKKLNAHLFFHLVSTIKQEYQQYVRNVPMLDGVAAFRAMIASYEPHSKAAAKQLLKKLLLSLTQSGKTMTVFVANIVEMMGKLKAIIAETNIDLFEALMILILLDGMDPEHGILREQLLLDDNITFTAASAACIKKAEIVSYERFADDTTVQAKAATATDNYCATCFKKQKIKNYITRRKIVLFSIRKRCNSFCKRNKEEKMVSINAFKIAIIIILIIPVSVKGAMHRRLSSNPQLLLVRRGERKH